MFLFVYIYKCVCIFCVCACNHYFFSFKLKAKLEVLRQKGFIPQRKRMLSELPRAFTDISPLTMKDIQAANKAAGNTGSAAATAAKPAGNIGGWAVDSCLSFTCWTTFTATLCLPALCVFVCVCVCVAQVYSFDY